MSNFKELTDAKLGKVVGGVSFTAAASCTECCKYKYAGTLTFSHSLI